MNEDIERKKYDYDTLKQTYEKEKKLMQDKVDANKKKLQEVQDESM